MHRLTLYRVHWKNALCCMFFFSLLSLNLIEDRMTRDKRLFDKKTAVIKWNQLSFPSSSFSHTAPQRPCSTTISVLFIERCSLRVALACCIPACDGGTAGIAQVWRWPTYCSCCSCHGSPWWPRWVRVVLQVLDLHVGSLIRWSCGVRAVLWDHTTLLCNLS